MLLGAAVGCLCIGLRKYWQRIQRGKPWFSDADDALKRIDPTIVKQRFNAGAFIKRGLMTGRLRDRPVSGSFHDHLPHTAP